MNEVAKEIIQVIDNDEDFYKNHYPFNSLGTEHQNDEYESYYPLAAPSKLQDD